MARPVTTRLPKPTAAELEILKTLWRYGPKTVRQVHERLGGRGYTTVLKLMQIMADKGLVDRDESSRAHIYRPRLARRRTQTRLVRDLLDRVFSGSATLLVQQALATRKASKEEIAEIRRMLDRYEGGEQA